jgi:5-methylthioribose kinase
LGRGYRADGAALVHGDFFPGSWLRSERGITLIDPEFCFLGSAEYDLGVFLAHLELTGSRSHWAIVQERYGGNVDWTLTRAFAGAELMRRLIGVAQLPLAADLKQKSAWLEQSRDLVCAV